MREIRRTVFEAVVIGIVSVGVGFGANVVNNAVFDAGLRIPQNYFKRLAPVPPKAVTHGLATDTPPSGADKQPSQAAKPAVINPAEQRLRAAGVGVAHYDDVKAMLADPLYGSMQFLIDARDDEHYQAGHLAGAYQLDHYRADRYLPTLLPMLLPADKIIIYCNGGDCEDSELAARDLIENGINHSRIHVYLEGYQEWVAKNEPVEKGERGSGNIAP